MNIAAHLHKQLQLLALEHECEKEEYKRLTMSMGLPRRIKRGICWHPLKAGRQYYNSLNQLVLELERTDDKDIEHSFEFGKPIEFFDVGPDGSVRYLGFQATVSYADDARMVAVMPSAAAIEQVRSAASPGVQLSLDETSYQAMRQALAAAIDAKDNSLARLRDALLGTARLQFRQLPPSPAPWLNDAQQKAVARALEARHVAIVHGPPGTGKTTTLVEAIYQTLLREPQALVCAQSNTAVDWISEQLVDRGVNVLRIGNPTRVDDKMLSFTYEHRFADHPSYPELWAIRRQLRQLRHSGSQRSGESRRALADRLRRRAQELEIAIDADLFNQAHVVASTLVGSSLRVMAGHHFPTLFIDEAAQALEAACWIAMAKADRVVLAGDHKQLPPTIKSIEAARGGLDRTLMETVAELHPEAVTLLHTQYRMHQRIMEFSSRWFYGGMLQAAPQVRFRGILDLDEPITWVDTSHLGWHEQFVGDSFGRINKPEADLLIGRLKAYVGRIGLQRITDERIDFALISPYRAQVQYLRSRINADADLKSLRGSIAVNTVDGFQGQERDVVMISLVRANDTGSIGFLADLRRMNVAMTRARMKLLILGDASTLGRHPFYAALLRYIGPGAVEQHTD